MRPSEIQVEVLYLAPPGRAGYYRNRPDSYEFVLKDWFRCKFTAPYPLDVGKKRLKEWAANPRNNDWKFALRRIA